MSFQTLLRWSRWVFATSLCLGLIYGLAAWLLNLVPRDTIDVQDSSYRYFACDNGVHVDLVLPVVGGGRDWRDFFPPQHFSGDVAGASFLSLGWGAEGFFATTPRWRDIRPGPVIKALFWLDRSVLHVTYHGDPAGAANCRPLASDAAGQARLFAFIDATLALENGRPQPIALPGYGPVDAFYAAEGRYSLFRTCNVWSSDALYAAGQPMSLWSPFSFQVMELIQK